MICVGYSVGDAVVLRSGSYMRELYCHEGVDYESRSRQMMRSIVRLNSSERVGIVTLIDSAFLHVNINGSTLIVPADSVNVDSMKNVCETRTKAKD